MKKKSFVTLFPICENSHLIKDIGQIPYFMHNKFEFNSKIVTHKKSETYSHLDGEIKGVELEFLETEKRISFFDWSIIIYIKNNAKLIDVLNLYHFIPATFIYGLLYKFFNPKGKLFIKLDAYNEAYQLEKIIYSKSPLKNLFFKQLEKILLRKVDIISIENKKGLNLFKSLYKNIENKLIYIPNGVNDVFLTDTFQKTKSFQEKENIIITTGRIGLQVKNNKMLLEVANKLILKNWKIYFVGPIDEDFKKWTDLFIHNNSKLMNNIFFTGEINDRKELYEFYNKSKIYCMTSPHESFGISFVEALYFGNYIFGTTGMSAFEDLSNNFEHGFWTDVNDVNLYATELQKMIDNQDLLKIKCEEIKTFTKKTFCWSTILIPLANRISK